MPLLKHHRAYRGILRRLGVKGENALELSDLIRPVAVVDELTHLQPPEEVGVYAANGFQAALPGHNSLALQASFPGVWILHLGASDSSTYRLITGAAHANAVGAAVAAQRLGLDVAPRSAVNNTTGAVVPTADSPIIDANFGALPALFGFPIFLPGGRVIELVTSTTFLAQGVNIIWQEIPDD